MNRDAAASSRDMIRKHLVAAATAAAALVAFPAAASAATTTVNAANSTITVAGDATSENIVIADAGGFITVDGAATTAPADNTFNLTVNAGDGNDTVSVNTTQLASVTVNGDAGTDTLNGSPENDVLNGGSENDTLSGGAGNDRLTGNTQSDTFNGDAGNDVMVWNNGDGNDVMNGGANTDDAELNGGNNSEQFGASPLANGRVKFERIAPAPINLDVSADTERLVLNAAAGDDSMTSDPAVTTAMLLNGGVGSDNLVGGSGPDVLNGGEDNDALRGGIGGDRLVGDRGGDIMAGNDGDDVLVWNNGDGSDVMDGENGLDKIEVNGSATGADVMDIAPTGARSLFRRTNVGAFSLDIATAELLDVRGLGGDDTFVAQPGTPLAVLADGGDGNDTLTGADEPDTFFGGAGNDSLTGGGGPDLLDGQDGDDHLFARDGAGDLVRGGLGTDAAQVDSVDVVSDVENVDAPAPAPATKNEVSIETRNAIVRNAHGRYTTRIKLACADTGTGDCEGRLTILTKKSYNLLGIRTPLVLAAKRYDVAAGHSETLTVRLPKGVKLLAKQHKIAAVAQTADGSEALTLKFKK
jgi:Ca2+-binding RTX toxin-like protein